MYERFVKTTTTWKRRRAERYALNHMDERLLRDIGMDRYTATRESRKPFWRQ